MVHVKAVSLLEISNTAKAKSLLYKPLPKICFFVVSRKRRLVDPSAFHSRIVFSEKRNKAPLSGRYSSDCSGIPFI